MNIEVDNKLLNHLEKLSMLKLKTEEREELAGDIKKILDYMSLLDELDLGDIEGMVSPVEKKLTPREDKNIAFQNTDKLIQQFPDREDRFLKVPAIYNNE